MEMGGNRDPYRDGLPSLLGRLRNLENENARLRELIRRGFLSRRRMLREKINRWFYRPVLRVTTVGISLGVLCGLALFEMGFIDLRCQTMAQEERPPVAETASAPIIIPTLRVFGRVEAAHYCLGSQICQTDIEVLPLACWPEWFDCDLPVRQAGLRLRWSDEENETLSDIHPPPTSALILRP